MKNLLAITLVVAATCILTTKALDFGTSAADAGMAALNDKYRYRCVSLGDGKRGTVLSIRAKTVRLSVLDAKGVEQVVEIKRQPLDRFIVPCTKP
ncbi:hypothetical protein OIU34_19080 [Pararhizobium sp. BT-229]|uniref:hypothetical protein n=1 Tax=Pararhizobium sp. BT-229 TaxID=2986923 RepID=UPI0021F70133|nr:hypothetical protein [Pararhizobium sp. BT-229]MCV9963986.1 hypothetical protein [Pararhizobium sp. BT-229]